MTTAAKKYDSVIGYLERELRDKELHLKEVIRNIRQYEESIEKAHIKREYLCVMVATLRSRLEKEKRENEV